MIYLYGPNKKYTGNHTTLNRLSKLLKIDIINQLSLVKKDDLVIALHLYKSGKYFLNKHFKFIIIVTGTDLNIDYFNNKKRKIINRVIEKATFVVCLAEYMAWRLPQISKVKVIRQSVKVPNFEFKDLNLGNKKIILWVGTFRYVKDPLYLDSILKLLPDDFILYQVGNFVNHDLIIENDRKQILNSMEYEDLINLMKQSYCLVNTSKSEGMASSILEAMYVKLPVICRKNRGNCEIIVDDFNGYIFNKPIEFLDCIKKLDKKRSVIIRNAKNYVHDLHYSYFEKKKYENLINICNKKTITHYIKNIFSFSQS